MTKTKIQIIACEETYQNLKTFEDINQLNDSVRVYKEQFKDQLTKSAVNILTFIHGFSAKYPGVSFLNKNTIATKLEISRRTVIRACQLLESLGIIKQYEMKRKTDMLQSCNAIVIQPVGIQETTESFPVVKKNVTQETAKMSLHENNIFLKPNNNINHLNVKRSPYIKFVPKTLQHYQAYFGKLVKTLYSRVWLAAKKLNLSTDTDIMQNIGFEAFEQLKQYVKDGKNLSEEQLCKLAYAISYKQLEQRLETGEILDWNYIGTHFFKQKNKKNNSEL